MNRPGVSALAALVIALAGCAGSRDTRTSAERDRDARIWMRAHNLLVASAPTEVRGCSSLGVVKEHYYEEVPPDPVKSPHMTWPEYVLRFKTAELGGNAAVISPVIDRWEGRLDQSRVLGEAYVCRQNGSVPASTTASR